MGKKARWGAALAALAVATAAGRAAAADSAWTYGLVYKADVMGVVGGDAKHAGRYLDNLDLSLDGDLERAIGWKGATLHLDLLNNSGGQPNDIAQTLQGVDNIEVSHPRARLFELWIEQQLADGRASIRAGLYDLNSEFYNTDASHLLIAPPFGIGSEFSATGPNGPSIFPLTSLAVRVRAGRETGGYVQAAALSAHAGALSDPKHLQLGLDRGAILIGEAGYRGRVHAAFGGWTYTERQDSLHATTAAGEPVKTHAHGGYVLAEGAVWRLSEDRGLSAFFRAGASEGRTTPFNGGWQAGLRFDGVVAGRPKSAASIGLQQAFLSSDARAAGLDAGVNLARSERGLEVTYADTIGPVTLQPDLQIIRHPGGELDRDMAVVGALRITIALP